MQKMATNSHPWLPATKPTSLLEFHLLFHPSLHPFQGQALHQCTGLQPLPRQDPSHCLSSSCVFNISGSWPWDQHSSSHFPISFPHKSTEGTLVCSSDCYWLLAIQSPSFFWKQLPLALAGHALVTMWSASLAILPAGEAMPLSSGLGST